MHFLRALVKSPAFIELLIAAAILLLEFVASRWGSRQLA